MKITKILITIVPFKVEKMIKKRYYRNRGLNLAWDLGVIFLEIKNFANFEF